MLDAAASRFRPFEVISKVRESATITSFRLAPLERQHWRPFEAGQFLTMRVPDRKGGHVLRNYTVSSSPREEGSYRITVKREAAPSSNVPNGLSSCWLHDEIEPGAVIEIDPPRGAFKLDSASARPVVLLSGGVGLTPTVSMLDVLAKDSNRPVWFIHACDGAAVHALRDEVEHLAALRPGITVHYCYRFAEEADRKVADCHSTGFLTRTTLQSLLPLDDYDFYMCGPQPFMQALYGILTGFGVRKERIAYEFFGPASLLTEAAPSTPRSQMAFSPNSVIDEEGPCVVLQKSGIKLAWDSTSESILAFLEAQGIEPEFSCRAGVCGTCEQGLVSGEVDYFEEPLDQVPDDRVLLCCTRPKSSIVLDL
ncbi:2Fe-2S iron-sulfur cluster binding domain-containing protein [Ensifer sp. HO-A22]|uniref:nitric oxide dioxygenase n=1 Tax=Ensifer oleiphilus TaxID=2742698 RepID=A0A7Y6UNH8_9HYPH|nr:FAD-binding oxidoreductase [Ensifer oleiphilus]NVD40049.1 2Fe-2S iron-sulfur cluster binding domain-containing protein [Ensifer oleiphilus]